MIELDLEQYIKKIKGFSTLKPTTQIDYITYFLTADTVKEGISVSDIENVMDTLNLKKYRRIAQYLSENASKRSCSK